MSIFSAAVRRLSEERFPTTDPKESSSNGEEQIELERIEVVDTDPATHLRYRVLR